MKRRRKYFFELCSSQPASKGTSSKICSCGCIAETRQNFNIWVYGDKNLSRGSGLFVPETGLASNHHFVLPADGTFFHFSPGQYVLEVFVTEIGARGARSLFKVNLEITPEDYKEFNQPGHGLYFDWGPDAGRYFAHIRPPPKTELPAFVREMFANEKEE